MDVVKAVLLHEKGTYGLTKCTRNSLSMEHNGAELESGLDECEVGVRTLEELSLFEREMSIIAHSRWGRMASGVRRRQGVDALLPRGRKHPVFSSRMWTHPLTRKIVFWRDLERSGALPVLEAADEGVEAQKPREGLEPHGATSS